MSVFPSITEDYLKWKQTLPQVMDWFDRAVELREGKYNDDPELSDAELDDGGFVWDENDKIWR